MPKDKKQIIADFVKIEGLSQKEIYDLIAVPADKNMGDFALPCFKLAKLLSKSPVQIAVELEKELSARLVVPITGVKAVNGFLNFTIDKMYFAGEILSEIVNKGSSYGSSDDGKGKTVCIDYSSVNIAKPFHIGHLSTTVIGGALYRTFMKLGYTAVGINHLGDWGTQFGKLISAFKRWGSPELLEMEGMIHLTNIYVRFHQEADLNPALNDEARAYFKKIEEGDEEALGYFNLFKEITLKEVEKVYKRLNIKFDSYAGESFYNDKMQPVLDKLKEKNLLVYSDGALIVSLDDYNMPPCLLRKADGATLYATRDLAAVFYRKETYDFYKCLYVVAYQQNLHFKQLFKVLELMGEKLGVYHVAFGMVSLEDGAMSTRNGKVVLLEDVLDKAAEKSLEIINQKSPTLSDKREIAEQIGVGAVIFGALYNNRIKDIVFSYDKVLNFDGETGPYVQYTHARCCSVLAKAGSVDFENCSFDGIDNPEALALVDCLEAFPNALKEVVEKYEPCFITRALVAICQAFNRFYYEHSVMNSAENEKASRILLVRATQIVIKEGLELLGISAPTQM